MTYGFDLEGTLDAEPDAFRVLCGSLVATGNVVYVITAYWCEGDRDPVQEEARRVQLEAIGFVPTVHYSALLFAPGSTVEEQATEKRRHCEHVSLMFEDRQVFTDEISKVTRCLLMQPRV